eukprot:TRINITY_DN271_c0_g1_i1.p1 TRINITY_DN271_c0_g1~~TRINITY_DN271_c0_g1_i1.p1  ORF type:complete len:197 (-),score=68.55 TRINITY_DN271_c0_g1_i1:165-719(-)
MSSKSDRALPAATLMKIVKRSLPNGALVAGDAKVALSESSSMFILYLTAAALDQCHAKNRSKIVVEDVLNAVAELELGFEGELESFLEGYKEAQEGRKKARLTEQEAADKNKEGVFGGTNTSGTSDKKEDGEDEDNGESGADGSGDGDGGGGSSAQVDGGDAAAAAVKENGSAQTTAEMDVSTD